ncbi:hypothetical protein GGI00_005789 [Coemansia sp. RSA 2681]|nr:hypothetical protein GGI00_005789 [Coemansia sp. RSA 2681]
MGQAGSKSAKTAARRTTAAGGGSKLRLPRTAQTPASERTAELKTREEMLGEDPQSNDPQFKDTLLESNLKRFLSPREHTTMTGMKPATDNTNVQALRQRQAGGGSAGRIESQQITGLLRDLAQGAAVEKVALDYKLDVGTVRSLQTFLCPVS